MNKMKAVSLPSSYSDVKPDGFLELALTKDESFEN
jgi:hypothetical protein